jgi:hypothetical protein
VVAAKNPSSSGLLDDCESGSDWDEVAPLEASAPD